MNTLRNPNTSFAAVGLVGVLLGAAACSGAGGGNVAPSHPATSKPAPTEGGNPGNGKAFCTTAGDHHGTTITFNTITFNGKAELEKINFGDGHSTTTHHPDHIPYTYADTGRYSVTSSVVLDTGSKIDCTTINVDVSK